MNEKEYLINWFEGMESGNCMELFQEAYKAEIEYTEEGIVKAQELIERTYAKEHKPSAALIRLFGFYLGETIIKNHPGAQWDIDSIENMNQIFESKIIYLEGDRIEEFKPFKRVIHYWSNRKLKLLTPYQYITLTKEKVLEENEKELNVNA